MSYLAAPVDAADDRVRLVRHVAKQALADHGFSVYDPTDAWVGSNDVRQQMVNLEAVRLCDAMLAVLLPDVCSVGVPLEIMEAKRLGLPVAVVTPREFLILTAENVQQFKLAEDAVAFLGHEASVDSATKQTGRRRSLPFAGEGELPSQAFRDDAGMDLFVARDCVVPMHGFADVPHNIGCELPEGVWGLLTGRSGSVRKRSLIVVNGIIDTGYRGELFAACYNFGEEACRLKQGERVAQLILLPNLTSQFEPQRVVELLPSDRGINGFGSTGA